MINNKIIHDLQDVIETELRAWAFEAISYFEVNPYVILDYKHDKGNLIESWLSFDLKMLDKPAEFKEKNEVIARLYRYVKRGLGKPNQDNDVKDEEVISWISNNYVFIKNKIVQFGDFVKKNIVIKPWDFNENNNDK